MPDSTIPANPPWLAAYQGRHVLVTGASGFVGRWVAHLLTAGQADLWLPARNPAALAAICDAYEIRGQHVRADLSAPGAFGRLFGEVQPEITFNLAGFGVDPNERDESLAFVMNEDLIREMAEAISNGGSTNWPGLRLVHMGSGAEYGNIESALVEDGPTAPVNFYGRAKLAGTCALAAISQRTGLRATTARAFTVYGPGEHAGRLLPSLLEAKRTGEPLRLTSGEQRRDFTYVAEVAEGLLRLGALTTYVPPVVNLATGELISVRQFAACAAGCLSLPDSQLQFGALPARPDELRHGRPDVRLLRHILGWTPSLPIHEGIRATIEIESRSGRVKG
jgi:UDP-glucose 4-epimerase